MKLPAKLFGERVLGWIRGASSFHIALGGGGTTFARSACGAKIPLIVSPVDKIPRGCTACRTCRRWLP